MYKSVEKTSPSEALEQIKIRREAISQMVGWLYPSIYLDEIEKLYKICRERWYFQEDI